MIFGIPVSPTWLLVLGLLLLVLLVFQILVGMRKIKFGRKTFVYHKWVAFTILGIAVVHGLLAMLFVYGWSVL
ncbi:MAG: hypothetical protein P4L93_10075 [Coriobacteriia bacterium]|nr:hypothetical protein [Coriobacteriia bacterium]